MRSVFLHQRLVDAGTRLELLHQSLDGYRDELSGAITDDKLTLQFMLQRQAIELLIEQVDRVREEMHDTNQDLQQVLGEITKMSTEIEAIQLLRDGKVLEYKQSLKNHSLEALNELILRQQSY